MYLSLSEGKVTAEQMTTYLWKRIHEKKQLIGELKRDRETFDREYAFSEILYNYQKQPPPPTTATTHASIAILGRTNGMHRHADTTKNAGSDRNTVDRNNVERNTATLHKDGIPTPVMENNDNKNKKEADRLLRLDYAAFICRNADQRFWLNADLRRQVAFEVAERFQDHVFGQEEDAVTELMTSYAKHRANEVQHS